MYMSYVSLQQLWTRHSIIQKLVNLKAIIINVQSVATLFSYFFNENMKPCLSIYGPKSKQKILLSMKNTFFHDF